MKCYNCGSEMQEGAKFCSFCGVNLLQNNVDETDATPTVLDVPQEEPKELVENNVQPEIEEKPKQSLGDKIKAKIRSAWERLPTFYKVSLVSILGLVLLFLVAYFTDKTFAIVCTVVQFVGIVVAMLLRKGIIKTDKKWLSYIVLIVAILLTSLNIYSYFWNRAPADVNDNNPNTIITPDDDDDTDTTESTNAISKTALLPFGDDEYIGKNQEDIVKILGQEGFNNISTNPISELEVEELDRKGEISKITVGGSEAFTKGTELDKTVAIEITYYDAKCIAAPITAKDAETKDTEELVNLFKDGGFLNVTVEIEEDIDPEYSQEAFRNEVSIGYDSSFDTTDTFPIDSKVTITSHRPMEKYKVKINIDFIPNFFFDKYSVDVELGYKELGTLSHGEDDTYELWLKPGKHEITFTKHSYKRPEKEVEFSIQGETEITYQITCHEDSIHVERTEFIDKGAVGEGEAMTPGSAWDFKYDNYKDVEEELKNAGFTNIKTAILYDIVWGWTSEGEVDSVSINGNDDFSKGDVFKKDAEIVITYHMWEEDDPNRPTESETTKPSSTTQDKPVVKDPNITTDNNADFAALMRITDQTDAATIRSFVNSHKGKVVEFDGCVALMMQHENYKTRFDVCLAGGDYTGKVYGPLFAFEDVNFYEMNVSGSDTVAGGMLFRIAGEIKGYSAEGGYIILEPVFMRAR